MPRIKKMIIHQYGFYSPEQTELANFFEKILAIMNTRSGLQQPPQVVPPIPEVVPPAQEIPSEVVPPAPEIPVEIPPVVEEQKEEEKEDRKHGMAGGFGDHYKDEEIFNPEEEVKGESEFSTEDTTIIDSLKDLSWDSNPSTINRLRNNLEAGFKFLRRKDGQRYPNSFYKPQ